jgi:hypothetical protein
MKPSIHNNTIEYLSKLAKTKKDVPDFHYNQLDAIDRLIYQNGIRIKQVLIDKDLDLLLVLLNNRKIIKYPISIHKELVQALNHQLINFTNDGFGIHWPDLDMDLSLYGFLNYEFAHFDKPINL